ncbi:DUF3298 and DUF4163 domain-containing protein [Mucilaginibacter polytrichastri]|uniref:DUF3298 domain-containing protein n=1 Tax=Mucilaginibacter polytrichastri TaxID=1302689 RepID=A0A1Q5ZXQ1_9SPHI|nr:DUF3298 and DUF4163 domain-containing protein [Mucilaginibacter polytrichastri]OKS86554.1 hypothetical protein RG47T_2010 [Mucilaginibacter polytrichastri]SFS79976.1 protein of unknown function [Mucilaginibacter polytrichastri]
MKMKLLYIPVLAAVMAGCVETAKNPDVKAGISKDTLTYQYKTFKQRADNCGNKPDSGCTVIKITYPVFTGQAALNDTVKRKLVGLFSVGDKTDTDFEPLAKNFMNAYKADLKTTDRKTMFYILNNKAGVIRQDSALTTLQIDGDSYLGGAHGAAFTGFINWATKAHKNLTLKDILVDGGLPQLNQVAEKIFRKQENLSDTSSLKNDYFFKDNKFSLNENFLISPIGLRFVYNQYEIKPYAAGKTDLVIPYTQIKKLLRPNTVVAQYIK